jgi:secondary thiamine-phosphate synthase enzyme
MQITHKNIALPPKSEGVYNITSLVQSKLSGLPKNGVAHFLLPHTSAAIGLNECFDDDVMLDLGTYFSSLVPKHDHYLHNTEGVDDMPAHIKAALIGQSLSVPIVDGDLQLGRWQGFVYYEFRHQVHHRTLNVTVIGAH